jgi:propanediol dehydratase large subunit
MTPKQTKFLCELFRTSTIKEACASANISETTAYRWMREDKEFKKELQKRKTHALEEVSTQMQLSFSESVNELLKIIRDERVSAQVKINAIDCLFRNAKPIIEEVDILNRLQEIEDNLEKEKD